MSKTVTALQAGTLEGRYRLLVDAITDYAIYMLDTGGHVSSWNTGANRFKEYTEAEILGQHFSRFYTDDDREAGIPQKALATAETEGRFEAEGWRVRKDGKRFWAHVVIDAIRDPNGELLGFAKITGDLLEQRAAVEELKRSEAQFRLLVQGVTDYAIYMLDPEGRVSSWNQGAQRIKGYEPEEIIGEHFSRFYTDEDRAGNLPGKALETAAREGRFEKEGWRLRKDGTRFWASVVIDAIRSEDGTLIGFAKVTRDVTEKRQAKEALERTQQALFQAQKMEAVGQLTGGIAHDFNNLLMAVLGSLEIAKKRALSGQDNADLIENAIQGARRGPALTQRLLAFSRKQDLKLEAVDVPNLVKEMAGLLQRSIEPRIEIATTFPLVTSGLPRRSPAMSVQASRKGWRRFGRLRGSMARHQEVRAAGVPKRGPSDHASNRLQACSSRGSAHTGWLSTASAPKTSRTRIFNLKAIVELDFVHPLHGVPKVMASDNRAKVMTPTC
jgi:PAS domain S-box-containing protein